MSNAMRLMAVLFTRRGLLAWWVLATTTVLLLGIWRHSLNIQYESAEALFQLHARDVVAAINKRLLDHEQILLGGAGYIESQPTLTREDWRSYVERLRLHENYPGIQGVGFSKRIKPQDLSAHEASVRAQGFPDYRLYPQGDRDLYTAIVYLEPFTGRNLAAFGYDMFAEPVRNAAMRWAVDNDTTSISSKVRLVQETHGEEQAGFLMYVPTYDRTQPLATAAQRWQALLGYVYSPYRIGDLMHGILGERELMIDFHIYDGGDASDKLFESAPAPHTSRYHAVYTSEAYGHQWTINLQSKPAFEKQFATPMNRWMPLMGFGFNLTLFALTLVLLGRRDEALRLLREMDLKRAESEQRFYQLFLRLGQGVIIVQADGIVLEANPAAEQILGCNPEQLRAPNGFGDAWQGLDANGNPIAGQDHPIAQALTTGTPVINVIMAVERPADGTLCWLRVDAYPQFPGAKVPYQRVYAVLTDITERKRLDQLKSEFVSTVSHELRTPLTSISGSLGLIAAGALGKLPEQAQHMVSVACKNSKRLADLINDLLDIEKLASGKLALEMNYQPLEPIIVETIELNAQYGAERNVKARLLGELPAVSVQVDKPRLIQALSNLISNAVKFSPDNGTVEISALVVGEEVSISVRDYGPGVPEEFHSQIFQKFAQADASDSRPQSGTGLGLAITRELTERMRGQVGFDSTFGRGAVFWIRLPLRVEGPMPPTITHLNVQ